MTGPTLSTKPKFSSSQIKSSNHSATRPTAQQENLSEAILIDLIIALSA